MGIVFHVFEADKPVASVCHSVEICGATFVGQGCVRDGNLVSALTWHDNALYMKELIRMLLDAKKLRNG